MISRDRCEIFDSVAWRQAKKKNSDRNRPVGDWFRTSPGYFARSSCSFIHLLKKLHHTTRARAHAALESTLVLSSAERKFAPEF